LKRSGDDRRKELNERLGAMNRQKREAEARKVEVEAALEKVSRKLVKGTLGRLRAELAEAKRALNTANRSLHSAQEIRAAAKMRLENAEEAEGFVAKLAGEIERKERKVSALQFLSYMCGKRGLPAQIIEGELQRIEGRCNWVLERLDYQKRVKFLPYKELSGYERVCPACGGEVWYKNTCKGCGEPRPHKRKDDPTIVVLDGEIERAFALESGGAQVLQSFAVRLAGGMFVSSMTGVPMRMVMLDEVFAHLDASNRQKLMALVISKLSSVFGLEQQLVVSHHDDVVNAVDDMLVVTRERGSSVVHWA
jgi:DNA repair exonuclease SbcCD ATPase subunit